MVFKKGFSGNPSGKRSSRPLTDALITRLMFPVDEKPRKSELKTAAHLVIEKMVQKALQGDMKAISLIYERLEGKAVATVATVPPPNKPIDIMDAARRLAFIINSAAALGEPLPPEYAVLINPPVTDGHNS